MIDYYQGASFKKGMVWFSGSDAIAKGQGLCFNLDALTTTTKQTATDKWGARAQKYVQLPDSTNNLAFAGVSTQNYPARAQGQLVEIWLPGGCAMVSQIAASTINSTLLTAIASDNAQLAGLFGNAGFEGRGTALALQTVALADGGDIAEVALAGSATAAYSSATKLTTISLTGIGTAAGYGDDDITATDFEVAVLGGADDTYGGDATLGELATIGIYPVKTAPTADTITVTGDTGDCDLTLVMRKVGKTVLVYLFDGEESGLTEYLSPQDATSTVNAMVGGVSFICGGYTMAADSTDVLADGTRNGMQKGFVGLGTLTTKTYKNSPTSAIQNDGATGYASVIIDAADEFSILQWRSAGGMTTGWWVELASAGATVA